MLGIDNKYALDCSDFRINNKSNQRPHKETKIVICRTEHELCRSEKKNDSKRKTSYSLQDNLPVETDKTKRNTIL